VTSAVIGWTLDSTPTGAGAQTDLELTRLQIGELPGGGCWVGGFFQSTVTRTLTTPALRGPAGATLPGSWRLRHLSVFDRMDDPQKY
jgi:hypothetical protein